MTITDDRASFLAEQSNRLQRIREVRAEAPPVKVDGSTAVIRVYQTFDDWGEFWGLSATELAAELDQLPDSVDTIELRINSRGGMVFEAVTIVNMLRAHPARVVAVVEGMAASAASFLAVSADETVMMPQSSMLLHASWGVCVGDATEMREMADMLDQLTLITAEIYAEATGETAQEWVDRFAEGGDLIYPAEQAVEVGLADRVESTTTTETDPAAMVGKGEGEAHAETTAAGFDHSLTLELLDI